MLNLEAQTEAKRRYKQTAKGKMAAVRYKKGDAGKAASARYFQRLSPEKRAQRLAARVRWEKKNPEKVKAARRRRNLERYGLTVAEWDALFAAQGNSCAVCKSPDSKSKLGWTTDHKHGSTQVRGILCLQCNVALGMVKDDPNTLRHLIRYLETGESSNAGH